MAFIVNGLVRAVETGRGVPDLRIQVWDQDERGNLLLGNQTTNQRGRFFIKFNQQSFRRAVKGMPGKQFPDLFVQVLAPDGTEVYSSASAVRESASRKEQYQVEIPDDALGAWAPLANWKVDCKRYQKELAASQEELAASQEELAASQEELAASQAALAEAERECERLQNELRT